MNELSTVPRKPRLRRTFAWFCTLCFISTSYSAASQEPPPSGAVETFDPVFDAAFEVRPRAGLYGITELMMAALEADVDRARQLIDAGANVNETDGSQSTALMWAVHSGDVEIVRFLISEGADVRATAFQGATALINAISGKQEAIAVVLIEAGANPNGRGNSRQNHLEAAADSGMTEVVDALIRNGAELSPYGSSALSYAISRGHYDVAVLLIDAGVDIVPPANSTDTRLLSKAAASGSAELVQLLLLHGADVNQPSGYRSPLNMAVSSGHTVVAELLVDNGATISAQTVLAAIQRRNADVVVALINRLDIDTLSSSDIEKLLLAAEGLGNDSVLQLLHQSSSVRSFVDRRASEEAARIRAASREHARLLFARQADDACEIAVWDSRSGDTAQLATIATCPDDVFVSEDGQSTFVVDGTDIQIVSTIGSQQSTEIPLPDLDYRAWVDQMTLRPDQNPSYMPPTQTMQPIGIGRFDDGSIGLLANLWMPADDSFVYLFRRVARQWSIVETRWCDRWGCEEPIDSLRFHSTNVWSWPESSMIWHENLSLNPFFLEDSVQMVDLEYESYQAADYQRTFRIDGALSVLRFSTSPSEHSDTTHTFGIELAIDGGPPKVLSGNQCLTSLAGRFLLVNEFFGGRFEVTDLGTGQTVLGDIKAAMWID